MSTKSRLSREDLLEKVGQLIAHAESTPYEGERQTFMEKAEELMMKYRIELWEIAKAQEGQGDAREPIVRDVNYQFAFSSGPFPAISDSLWGLWIAVARHAQCVPVFGKQHYSGENNSYSGYTIPVIGTEADLGYMELLFTSLMFQLVEETHPKVDKAKTYEENLRTFKEAGFNWKEVVMLMQEAGYGTHESPSKAYHTMSHDYRRYCKRAGIEQNYSNWKTYRRSFADGFVSKVRVRLLEMREKVSESNDRFALALRDQRKINEEFMHELFPQMDRTGTAVSRYLKTDNAAHDSGRRAGARADISANPSKGVRGKKELDR